MATIPDNNSNQSDFPSDQAAILRDLARNGSTSEVHMYVYGENVQANGAPSSMDFIASDAYLNTGLSNSFQDLDDPAALLESLANFDHVASGSEPPAVSNDHFASLLQAAATAGGQEAAQTSHTGQGQSRRSTRQSMVSEQFGFHQKPPSTTRSKRKRLDEDQSFGFIATPKRQKQVADDPEQLAREREIWGPEDDDEESESAIFDNEHFPIATADARAVGVHSAAALFRRPSAASKKYTRPPMSKLFTSLELTPEQFLHLQAAAKSYMLDENHPERSDCVGNRGRGDTDMVKLKLFGCVKAFLEDEGWGERCFGGNLPGAESRKLKWPQMKNKVISLVTPLLRRMVTNERQRRYAVESRKGINQGTPKASNKRQLDQGFASPNIDTQQHNSRERLSSPSPYPAIDPKLNQYHYHIDESFPSRDSQEVAATESNNNINADIHFSTGAGDDEGVKFVVNIMQDGRRIKPSFTLTPSSCPGFSSLIQHVHTIIDGGTRRTSSIQILSPSGLVDVGDEDGWRLTIAVIKESEWMDGEVKCVVQVDEE